MNHPDEYPDQTWGGVFCGTTGKRLDTMTEEQLLAEMNAQIERADEISREDANDETEEV